MQECGATEATTPIVAQEFAGPLSAALATLEGVTSPELGKLQQCASTAALGTLIKAAGTDP
jgi:hypothetical protein